MPSHDPLPPVPVFRADPALCIACGACVGDCPSAVLEIRDKVAATTDHFAEDCLDCEHCLAICPTGAASIGNRNPADSPPLGRFDPAAIERLIRGRRSIRSFSPDPVPPELLARLLEIASYAPTGVGARYRRFAVVHDPAVMAELRERTCRHLVANAHRLGEDRLWLAKAAEKWLEKGRDVIFRGAPHLLVVTAGPWASTQAADCIIALSHFDLMAQAMGVGTVWVGMVQMLLESLPETRSWLGIPDDHTLGYAMLFGMPKVHYSRLAQRKAENVAILEKLGE